MKDRFVVQHVATKQFWAGGNRWVSHPIAARWFDYQSQAELAALRELPDQRPDWKVRELNDECSDVDRSRFLDDRLRALATNVRRELAF